MPRTGAFVDIFADCSGEIGSCILLLICFPIDALTMFLDRAPSEKHRCKSPIERLEDSVGTFGSVPSPVVVKYGKDRSEGSVLDKYQVTRLLGGSQQSGVYLARRKTRRGEESEGCWGKQGDDEVFLLKYLRINVLDEERRESVQDFFDQLDKVKKIRHQNIVKVSSFMWKLDGWVLDSKNQGQSLLTYTAPPYTTSSCMSTLNDTERST